jgi:spermidine synthase
MGVILVAGGIASLAVLPLLTIGLESLFPRRYPVVLRIVLLTAFLFFPPSLVLGMVSPIAIKLTLADLARAGNVVGKVYAWSTVGSIVGTFLTGFVLIASFGTRAVVFGVGLTLVLLGVAAGDFIRRTGRGRVIGVVLAAVLGLALWEIGARDALCGWCDRETAYYCIRVEDEDEAEGKALKRLVLDHLIHGYAAPGDPTFLHYPYLQTYASMTAYVAQRAPRPRALFIGGGPYTLPRYLEAVYPGAVIEVAEIDPGVTRVVREQLGLAPDTRIVTYNADAREVIEGKQGGPPYDLVFGDAFNDFTVPYHLTTREFVQKVRNILAPDGLYVALVIDRMQRGRFLASFVWTLKAVFPHAYVLATPAEAALDGSYTYVVAASAVPLDPGRLAAVAAEGRAGTHAVPVLEAAAVEAWLRAARPVLLTDDYAPVDNLLAPVFLERGF